SRPSMRWARNGLGAAPPPVAAAALVALQLLAAAALGRGQGWPRSAGDDALAACLLALQVTLVYAVAHAVAGRAAALFAGALFALAPLVLAGWYFQTAGGTPPTEYRAVYRHDVLPAAFGLVHRSGIAAACLLLASAWLAVARTRAPAWAAAGASGAAAAGAALVEPHAWPALAAPVLAAAAGRRLPALAAAAATAGAGLLVLALARHVPDVPLGWHHMGLTLDSVREFTWSRRLLEYLPLAGLVGLARRSAPAAAFFGAGLVALVVFPLA